MPVPLTVGLVDIIASFLAGSRVGGGDDVDDRQEIRVDSEESEFGYDPDAEAEAAADEPEAPDDLTTESEGLRIAGWKAASPETESKAEPQSREGIFILTMANDIAQELAREALTGGLVSAEAVPGPPQRAAEGSTATMVLRLETRVPFFFKLDANPKLAKEGNLLRRLQAREDLPEDFRHRFPKVYAVREEFPFAYLMQAFLPADGFSSVAVNC